MEGSNGDVVTIEIPDCGVKIQTTLTLIDPAGVIFDSKTNAPIANASVSLWIASGNACTTTPAGHELVDGVSNPQRHRHDRFHRGIPFSAGRARQLLRLRQTAPGVRISLDRCGQ